MSAALQPPSKEVDIDFLVFIERHASDLLRWDILTFFGNNPEFHGTTEQIARQVGRRSQSIRPELGELALLNILEKTTLPTRQMGYRLTHQPDLRRMVLKLAGQQLAKE
ncbi:MAG: hypothetical protein D6768_04870 [Chloroflexi bacterium]|nr:MAG: hypothetical protein D6768_04870 [Chloroflexota bacterium]